MTRDARPAHPTMLADGRPQAIQLHCLGRDELADLVSVAPDVTQEQLAMLRRLGRETEGMAGIEASVTKSRMDADFEQEDFVVQGVRFSDHHTPGVGRPSAILRSVLRRAYIEAVGGEEALAAALAAARGGAPEWPPGWDAVHLDDRVERTLCAMVVRCPTARRCCQSTVASAWSGRRAAGVMPVRRGFARCPAGADAVRLRFAAKARGALWQHGRWSALAVPAAVVAPFVRTGRRGEGGQADLVRPGNQRTVRRRNHLRSASNCSSNVHSVRSPQSVARSRPSGCRAMTPLPCSRCSRGSRVQAAEGSRTAELDELPTLHITPLQNEKQLTEVSIGPTGCIAVVGVSSFLIRFQSLER